MIDDINILDKLPKEILTNILKNSDIFTIEDICITSQNICKTINIRNILLDKLMETNDNLDVSSYTIKELIRYSKIQPLKDYINIGLFGNTIYVYSDNRTIQFYNQKVEIGIDINQIIDFDGKPAILTEE